MAELNRVMFVETNPGPVKAAVALLGKAGAGAPAAARAGLGRRASPRCATPWSASGCRAADRRPAPIRRR